MYLWLPSNHLKRLSKMINDIYDNTLIYFSTLFLIKNSSGDFTNFEEKTKMRCRGSNSRRLSVPLKSDALTIEPPKLQTSIAQTQQYKPILTAFLSFLLFTLLWQCFLLSHSNSRFHCHNTVAILDSLNLIDVCPAKHVLSILVKPHST